MPSRAHTAATVRQQLDWSVPHVMSVSAPCASASPIRNSSLRILLPVSRSPVRSSRLIHSSTPSSAERRSSLRSGVGVYASSMRGMGGAEAAISVTISRKKIARVVLRAVRGGGLAQQPPHHEGVAHGIIPVVVVEQDVDLFALLRELLDLRHQRA